MSEKRIDRKTVLRLAQEAGISVSEGNSFADDMYISVLYRFANLVDAHTREACAETCKEVAPSLDGQLCSEAILGAMSDAQ